MKNFTKVNKKSNKDRSIENKLKLYDYIISNFIRGDGIIEPTEELNIDTVEFDYNSVSSTSYITKYYLIRNFPDYVKERLFDDIRNQCLKAGVKINFHIYGQSETINWDSDEMKNKMAVWKRSADKEKTRDTDVFDERKNRSRRIQVERTIESMDYLNNSEMEYKRSLCKISILIEISGKRGNKGKYIKNMRETMTMLGNYCSVNGIELKALKLNLVDWLQVLSPFSLSYIKEVNQKLPRRVVTDDILATMNGYKQGKIGKTGLPLGMDVHSKMLVLKDVLSKEDKAENWMVIAGTGSGKSFFIKHLIDWVLALGLPVSVIDYEGDEYVTRAKYFRQSDKSFAEIVSLGNGGIYCENLHIPSLTGVEDVDSTLKKDAIENTVKTFTIIVRKGNDDALGNDEKAIISTAIKHVYDSVLVTDNRKTWKNSLKVNINMVYEELKYLVKNNYFYDPSNDNLKQKAAISMVNACSTYFEPGETNYGIFKTPISVEKLFNAKFVVFSFGEKGKDGDQIDPVLIQLKQSSVANITTQLSNYHKYVMHQRNVCIWEEYQRYSKLKGSASIIVNKVTGGRKRGDFNMIITNDFPSILNDDVNPTNATLRDNITTYCIGKVKSTSTIKKFCETLQFEDLEETIKLIASSTKNANPKYHLSFCLMMDGMDKAVVKVLLPKGLRQSKLYQSGVQEKGA